MDAWARMGGMLLNGRYALRRWVLKSAHHKTADALLGSPLDGGCLSGHTIGGWMRLSGHTFGRWVLERAHLWTMG